jgi:hypothetical protein
LLEFDRVKERNKQLSWNTSGLAHERKSTSDYGLLKLAPTLTWLIIGYWIIFEETGKKKICCKNNWVQKLLGYWSLESRKRIHNNGTVLM